MIKTLFVCHYGICTDDCTVPDVHAGQRRDMLADPHIVSHNSIPFEGQFVQRRRTFLPAMRENIEGVGRDLSLIHI